MSARRAILIGGLIIFLTFFGVEKVKAEPSYDEHGCNVATTYYNGSGCVPLLWCGSPWGYMAPGVTTCPDVNSIMCPDADGHMYELQNGTVCPPVIRYRRCPGSGHPGMMLPVDEACPAVCGDQILQKNLGEECDNGEDYNGKGDNACTAECKLIPTPILVVDGNNLPVLTAFNLDSLSADCHQTGSSCVVAIDEADAGSYKNDAENRDDIYKFVLEPYEIPESGGKYQYSTVLNSAYFDHDGNVKDSAVLILLLHDSKNYYDDPSKPLAKIRVNFPKLIEIFNKDSLKTSMANKWLASLFDGAGNFITNLVKSFFNGSLLGMR